MVWTTNLLNSFVIIMLLTSLTGGILVLIWLGIGALLEKLGFINIIYELLKMVILFFFLPVSYIGLKLFEASLGRGFLFTPISFMWRELLWILGIWGTVVLMGFVALGYEVYRMNHHFRNAFSAKVAERRLLSEVCERLGLSAELVELKHSYQVDVPCVTGIRHAKVILPVEEFDEDTLRVILTHELTHFKQKDLLLKRISMVVVIFHFFNPLSWLLYERIQVWSEYSCDYRSYPHCDGMKHYFQVLMTVATEETKRKPFSSQLYENQPGLVERVKKLSKVSKMKKRAKLSVVLVMCVAFMSSSLSVCATTVQAAKAYEYLYRVSEVTSSTDDGSFEDNYIEYTESGEASGITLVENAPVSVTRALYNIVWDVASRSRVSAAWFNLTEGQQVSINMSIIPVDVTVRVGLERDNGTRRYVEGTDIIHHTFDVLENGVYRVYIQNDSYTDDVSVEGSYIIK